MKKKLLAALTVAVLLMSFMTSCLFQRECDIIYDYGGARDNAAVTVAAGTLIPRDCPEREGYIFGGWYTDSDFKMSYDFSAPVASDMTLYAKWIERSPQDIDYEELINSITADTVRATVKLTVEKYDVNIGFISTKTNVSVSSGSGVIYEERDGYYYCLTNNHVVARGTRSYAEVSVTDYRLDSYSAEIVCSDASYDLAVVRFKKNASVPLGSVEIESGDFAIGDLAVAIGSPGGQMNAVTLGSVVAKETVAVDAAESSVSNVTFEVIKHDAPMSNGSSGGALLSADLKIMGINYAAASNDGEFVYGYAVPAQRIREFLSLNDLI